MWKTVRSLFLMIFGCALTAAAFGLLILPQDFAAGGVTGLAVLLQQVIPLQLSVLVFCCNAILFVLGLVFVGKAFVLRSLLSLALFPVFLEVFSSMNLLGALAVDPFLSSVLAGCILGLGAGLVLLGDGSNGGFDIVAVILHKKFHLPVSPVMYLCDFSIILAHTLFNSLLDTAYGVVVVLIASYLTNQILVHGQSSGQLLIFSQHHEAIRQELLHRQDVGMTFLHGETGFRRDSIEVIVTVVPYRKVESVKRSIYQIDPTAFVVMTPIHYVGGRGYTLER